MAAARVRALLIALSLVFTAALGPSVTAAADPEPDLPVAKLVHRSGDASPGSRVQLQVEVSWTGRPERHLLGTPKIELPKGASLRVGRTGSRFDGTATRWWTDLVVQLPDKGGPWTFGPATLVLRAQGRPSVTLSADAIEIGQPSPFRALLGQGIGNGIVVGIVLLFVGWRYRSLAPPAPREAGAARGLLERARAELATDPEGALGRAVEARLALDAFDMDNAAPPTAASLRARHEAARFGGESIDTEECREILTRLEDLLEREE